MDEYWVADLVRRVVVVHRQPVGDAYSQVTEHQSGQVLNACGVDVDLGEFFGFVAEG